MNSEPVPQQEQLDQVQEEPRSSKGLVLALLGVIALIVIAWFLVRPGVFTVQPIGAIPEGVTIVYHSRNPEMSLFSSPDGLCLEMQGSVNLFCRAAALSAMGELADRIILRLPYSHWAYLQSTGGVEFDR